MYVPMMKSRQVELKVLEETSDLFSDEIIPLIEILNEKFRPNYKIEPNTGEIVREIVNGRKCKKKIPPTKDCIITLENINSKLNKKKVFVDYFRFREKDYGSGLDFKSLQLSWHLSNNEDNYLNYVEKICKFENMVPVISIKKGFDINVGKLKVFIEKMHTKTTSIALRITEDFLSDYSEMIENYMNENDYLLFDIHEQNPDSKIMELMELSNLNCECKKILLNSPRNCKYKNSDFSEHGICDLIFTSARTQSEENSLYGFGDYCGLKDCLPKSGGSGKGAALALFYDSKINKFYSYVEKNTDLGFTGYKKLIPIIVSDSNTLDSDDDCLAMVQVDNLYQRNSSGNWSSWHRINMIRSIQQIFKYYNQ